jgi:hypothetical protein
MTFMAKTAKKANRKMKAKKSSIRTTKRSPKPATSVKYAKRIRATKKSATYWKGDPKGHSLKISYNGMGNEFAFTLANNNGKVGGTFHVSGNQLINIMGIPLMVIPT